MWWACRLRRLEELRVRQLILWATATGMDAPVYWETRLVGLANTLERPVRGYDPVGQALMNQLRVVTPGSVAPNR